MIGKKPQVAPVTGDDVIAVLRSHVLDLDKRRDAVTKQIIDLEKTTAASMSNDSDLEAERARALLYGGKFDAAVLRERPLSKIAVLYAERDLIDKALRIGRSEHMEIAARRGTEIWASHFAEIAEIDKRRVRLALELQATNRRMELLREKIRAEGGAGVFSTDSADLLGLGDRSDNEVAWCVERLIADGLVSSRAEIERG